MNLFLTSIFTAVILSFSFVANAGYMVGVSKGVYMEREPEESLLLGEKVGQIGFIFGKNIEVDQIFLEAQYAKTGQQIGAINVSNSKWTLLAKFRRPFLETLSGYFFSGVGLGTEFNQTSTELSLSGEKVNSSGLNPLAAAEFGYDLYINFQENAGVIGGLAEVTQSLSSNWHPEAQLQIYFTYLFNQ